MSDLLENIKPLESRIKVCGTLSRARQYVEVFENLNIEYKVVEHGITKEEFLESIAGSHGILCDSFPFVFDTKALDADGSQLKIISTISSGYEHIDIEACRARNILVGHLPSVIWDTVAEYTLGLLLNLSRKITLATHLAKTECWYKTENDNSLVGKRVKGSVVGIYGLGGIGLALVKKLSGLELKKIIYHNRSVNEAANKLKCEYVSFEQLLSESDFLICTCSANIDNLDKFNLEAFKKMKPDSAFINVSRGHVVNHNDLYEALSTKIISAAAIDVTKPEPLPKEHPLFNLDNCIITPHTAWNDEIVVNEIDFKGILNLIYGITGKPLLHQVK